MLSCASSRSRQLNAHPLHYTLFRWRTYCVGLAGWQAALCPGARGLATPFLFHKCSSDAVIFSWSQSQNLFGPLRTYAFAVQVSVIIVANPDMRPLLQRVCMIHPLVLQGGKVLSKNLGQKIHELLCIIATLTICVGSHGHACYGYFIPTFLSRNHLFSNI